MNFHLLASGSKGNAFVLEKDGSMILIDCGTTKKYMIESLTALNLNPEMFDSVLITHNHSDHVRQINMFKNHPNIYTPEPLAVSHKLAVPYEPFKVNQFVILPLPTSHDADTSLGYVIQDGEHKLVYMTDTGYVKTSHLEFMRDADYIILESNHDPDLLMKTSRPYFVKQRSLSDTGHLSNDSAGEVLSQIVTSRTKEIILAHLSEEGNREDLAIHTVSKYLNGYQGLLKVGRQREIVSSGEIK